MIAMQETKAAPRIFTEWRIGQAWRVRFYRDEFDNRVVVGVSLRVWQENGKLS
jgi:hypothetical protein